MNDYVSSLLQQTYDKSRSLLEERGWVQKSTPVSTEHDSVRNFIKNHPYITTSIVSFGVRTLISAIVRQVKMRVPANTVLEIDLEDLEFTSQPVSKTGFESLLGAGRTKMHYLTFVEILKLANQNKNVVGIILHFQGTSHNPFAGISLSDVQEMRKALDDFKGEKIAHALSFDKPVNYYLASACDKIFVNDQGMVVLNGFQLRNFFVKELLEKAEIEFFAVKRAEYKSALNMFTESKYNEYHKEQVENLAKEIFDTMIEEIARSREKNAESIREWFDIGLFSTKDAVLHKVVDGVKYRDEIVGILAQSLNIDAKKVSLLYIQKYLEQKLEGKTLERLNGKKKSGSNVVAVIYASGGIQRGRPEPTSKQGSTMYSHVIVDAIYKARKSKEVKVILFRVDSPGGEAIASEAIRRELELAKTEDGKKIVVSMGGVAASGGYWISLAADKIVANPFTITGSIGVLSGKFFVGDFFANKLGITNDSISTSKNASVFSSFDRINEQQAEMFNNLVDDYYESFIEKVSQSRNISKEDLKNQIAKGKVYLGNHAKQINLIDRVGGFYEAVQVAKEVADMKEEPFVSVYFPKKKSVLETVLSSQSPTNSKDRANKSQVSSSIFQPLVSIYTSICGLFKFSNLFMKHSQSVEKYVQILEKCESTSNGNVKAEFNGSIQLE